MMNIVYSCDRRAWPGLIVSVTSLLRFNDNINLYILTLPEFEASLGEGEILYLKSLASYMSRNVNIKSVDCSQEFHNILNEGGANRNTGFTPFSFTRLLIGDVLNNVDYCLWLDADTYINDSIESWYYENTQKYPLCGTYSDPIGRPKNGVTEFREFVSGIMTMNVRKLRNDNFFHKAIDILTKEEYHYPDQFAITNAYRSTYGCEIPAFGQDIGFSHPLWTITDDFKPKIIHFIMDLVNDKPYTTDLFDFKRKFPQFKDTMEIIDKFERYRHP